MFQRSLPEQNFALLNVGVGKRHSLRCNLHVAFFQPREPQQDTGLKNRQQILDVHDQFFGQAEQILAAAAVMQQFDQPGDSSHAGMGQHLVSGSAHGSFLFLQRISC